MRIFIKEFFAEVETKKNYTGYFYSVIETITIVILGTFCGLRNMKQIHQWASDERIWEFMSNEFDIYEVPSYSWFTQILGMINPESFNKCFIKWVSHLIGDNLENSTLSFDGKTVRSTAKMKKYDNPLHIVSAQLAEFGITIGQKAVDGKSNEIPAVRDLIGLLNIKGCVIVADALNCQKETAKAIIENGGDYLLCVKGNQKTLNIEITDYIQDDSQRLTMDCETKTEKNRDRIETRTAYTTCDVEWFHGCEEWQNLRCIGAINTIFQTPNGITNEWHYYISSKSLSAEELLERSRKEWSVESMHWLLDVHYSEDFCRAAEQRTQENLNIVRKIVINAMRGFKNANNLKTPFSHLMLDCLIDPKRILKFLH